MFSTFRRVSEHISNGRPNTVTYFAPRSYAVLLTIHELINMLDVPNVQPSRHMMWQRMRKFTGKNPLRIRMYHNLSLVVYQCTPEPEFELLTHWLDAYAEQHQYMMSHKKEAPFEMEQHLDS